MSFYEKGRDLRCGHRNTERRRPGEDRQRLDWDTASQGTPHAASSLQKPGEGYETDSPQHHQKEPMVLTPWFQTSSLQYCDRIHFCSFKPTRLMLNLRLQYLATWCKEPPHWKRPWCWERLRTGEKGGTKWWDDWMASPTQWMGIWANSGM